MVDAWPAKPFTFHALKKTFGTTWLRCDLCRRYAPLRIAGLHDVDYRERTFSCSKCGAEAYWCMIEPTRELGMGDYRLDVVEAPTHHPAAVDRLSGQRPRWRSVDHASGELPGRKVDPRR